MLEKIAPTVRKITGEAVDLASMQMALRQMAFLFVPPGGAPRSGIADAYIAACVERQYKMSAVPGGVYGTACTEGSVRGAAESGRVMALGKRFRSLQKGSAQKFGEAYEMRRMAIQACHECSYEEKLVVKYYKAASAVVLGESEKMGVCARYASGETKEEEYMVGCVEKQSKMRAVSGGVYDVMCQDGSVGGMAEYKRVQALAAAFRAGQAGTGVKEQRKFDARRYGRERFGHGCHYEEGLFNQYPAVGMAMRPRSVKY